VEILETNCDAAPWLDAAKSRREEDKKNGKRTASAQQIFLIKRVPGWLFGEKEGKQERPGFPPVIYR